MGGHGAAPVPCGARDSLRRARAGAGNGRLFGILAYAVQRRMRDLGVRRALGASTLDVVRSVVADAGRVVAAGALAGIGLSIALARVLASMLFGVAPLDPVTFAAVLALLALTAIVAIAGPAWKATRVDPVAALRSE